MPTLSLKGRGWHRVRGTRLLHNDGKSEILQQPLDVIEFELRAGRFAETAGRSCWVDGYGLHRAIVPGSRPRLLLWVRFGNFFNETAYRMVLPGADRTVAQSVLARIPATPRHRYIFRYMSEALSAV